MGRQRAEQRVVALLLLCALPLLQCLHCCSCISLPPSPPIQHAPNCHPLPNQKVPAAAQQQEAATAAAGAGGPARRGKAQEVVRGFYEAYNRRDLDTINTLIADDISYQLSGGWVVGGSLGSYWGRG